MSDSRGPALRSVLLARQACTLKAQAQRLLLHQPDPSTTHTERFDHYDREHGDCRAEPTARLADSRLHAMMPMWCTQLRTALGLADSDWHAGQHLAVVDTERCSGALLLVYAMLIPATASTHVICFSESPLHYQHVCRKLGGAQATSVVWSDLTGAVPTASDALFESIAAQWRDAGARPAVVVVDSLFPLQCAGLSALDLVDALRRVRVLLGDQGCLVTLAHGDAFVEHMALLAYECDVLLSVRDVSSADVSGRLALTTRGQREPREVLFTVADTTVHFRPI